MLQRLWEGLPVATPDAVLFPRKALDLGFAVLLMRASYDAVDDLDFIAMDKFQVGGFGRGEGAVLGRGVVWRGG